MTRKEIREQIMSDEDRIAAWKAKERRCYYCQGQRLVETITDRLFGCCFQCAVRDNNATVIKTELLCICCGKQIKEVSHEKITSSTVDLQGFSEGIAGRISAGYGSTLDGSVYMVAICDKCAKQKQKEGRLTFAYNYIHD